MVKITALLLTFCVALAAAAPGGKDRYPPKSCTQCVSSPNNCDITAPCSSFGSKLFCGCRPGYRAKYSYDHHINSDQQWRISKLDGHQHRVWVAPGVICDTLCNNPFGNDPCGEVPFVDQCFI